MSEEYTIAGLDWSRGWSDTAIIAISNNKIVGIAKIVSATFRQSILQVVNFIKDNNVSEVVSDGVAIGDPLNDQLRSNLCDLHMNVRVTDKRQTKTNRAYAYYLVEKALTDNEIDLNHYQDELDNPFYHTAFGLCLQLIEDRKPVTTPINF